MSGKTKIEWTDATWNPIRGCSRVSEGCRNCYAERIASRFSGPGQPFEGLAEMVEKRPRGNCGTSFPQKTIREPHWTGDIRLVESVLEDPLHWRKPRKIFVNSMSDLFHEKVQDDWLARIFGVMLQCPQHTFQILTKRPVNMKHFMRAMRRVMGKRETAENLARVGLKFPLPNIWLGVSVEDQKTADERIPILLQTPAAVRWVSYEPALGPVDFTRIKMQEIGYARFSDDSGMSKERGTESVYGNALKGDPHLNWIVCGGESGPGARPMHPDWAVSCCDQCQNSKIPFFFKQWGGNHKSRWLYSREWNEFPVVSL